MVDAKTVLPVLLAVCFVSQLVMAATSPTPATGTGTTTLGGGTVNFLKSLQGTLQQVGPALSAIMFVLAGIIYAFGQLQPAEARGKYQAWAMGLIVGGFVVGALSVAAPTLASIAGGLLT